ncbi:MAG: response regulator transcription factor [Sedimentisphaerales bacterium]
MRILIIEDDKQIASFIINGLKENGFAVDHADNGEDGLHLALIEPYDAAIIDVMLPKRDGLSIIGDLRQNNIRTPIIVLSAKSSVDDRVKGLQMGGDDYLTKPFAFSELLARIQALIRRHSRSIDPHRLCVDNLCLDLLKHEVTREGEKIDLQLREFALLEYLMRNVNIVVSKTMIMEHVWNYNFDPQTNVVDVLVCRVRSKIDRKWEKKMIHTLRGVGYVLKSDNTENGWR